MPANGSSSSSTSGSVASIMAISSWRCSPWLIAPAIALQPILPGLTARVPFCTVTCAIGFAGRPPPAQRVPGAAGAGAVRRQRTLSAELQRSKIIGFLVTASQPCAADALGVPAGDDNPAQSDLARCWRQVADGRFVSVDLPAPLRRPDHRMNAVAPELQQHIVDRCQSAKALGQPGRGSAAPHSSGRSLLRLSRPAQPSSAARRKITTSDDELPIHNCQCLPSCTLPTCGRSLNRCSNSSKPKAPTMAPANCPCRPGSPS